MKRNLYYTSVVFALVFSWIFFGSLTHIYVGAIEKSEFATFLEISLMAAAVFSALFYAALHYLRKKYFTTSISPEYRPGRPFKIISSALLTLCIATTVTLSYPRGVILAEQARAEAARKAETARVQAERDEKERQRLAAMTPEERAAEARSKVEAANGQILAEGEAMLKRRKERETWATEALLKGKTGKEPDSAPVKKDEWNTVIAHLSSIQKDQPAYKKAQTLLARLDEVDKKAVADSHVYADKERIAHRKEFAEKLEQSYLDKRLDTDVTVSGPRNTVLQIKWVLANKVTANDISNSGIPDTAEKLGFKKIILTDGYHWNWKWELTPTVN